MTQLVFGIDIIKGSVRSSSLPPSYGLVRVENSRVVSEEKGVSLFRLLRFIKSEEPDILAVDSIQEIAEDDSELFKFLSALPAKTKLVQVTGDGVKMESLPVISERYNLKFDKFNPMEEAKASALAASYGAGYEVIAFENSTVITVSRARSIGRGGWSQNRYVRKVHGAVRLKAREIENRLKENNISYSLMSKSAFGGESRIVINAEVSGKNIPVRPMKNGDVQVKVEGKRKSRIEFMPLSKRPPYIIVGIDPGTTVGIAVLNLDGEVLHLSSIRGMSSEEIISKIAEIGKPAAIAADKAEMPAGVEKIRRAFSAAAWTPKKDLQIKEKYDAVIDYKFDNDHERDSLAAAVLAYRYYNVRFANLSKKIPTGTDINCVKAGIIKDIPLEKILKSKNRRPEKKRKVIPTPLIKDEKDEIISKLEDELRKSRKLAGSLSDEIEAKNKAIASLQKRLVSERDERNIDILSSDEIEERDKLLRQANKALRKEERKNKNLRTKLERMKHYISLQAGEGHLALKVMQLLAKDHLKSMNDEMGVSEDDIIYVLKIDGWGKSVIRDIADAKVRAVILPRLTYQRAAEQHLIDEFREIKVPLLSGADLSPRVNGKIGIVNEPAFEKALDDWNKSEKAYLKNRKTEEISTMVGEYQVVRKKEVEEFGIDPSTYEFKVDKKHKSAHVNKIQPEKQEMPKKDEADNAKPKQPKPKIIIPKHEENVKDTKQVIEKNVEDMLLGVLSEYRRERKKENDENG